MTYGSAVGAIHTYISSLTDPSGIEFRIRLIPRLGASVKLDILIPLGNALHSHETMDMPPRYGAGFSVSSQNGETPFFSKMGWQNDNHLALSSGGVLTNG
jgi:hypothetical protein